jgi:hypothetical protein
MLLGPCVFGTKDRKIIKFTGFEEKIIKKLDCTFLCSFPTKSTPLETFHCFSYAQIVCSKGMNSVLSYGNQNPSFSSKNPST